MINNTVVMPIQGMTLAVENRPVAEQIIHKTKITKGICLELGSGQLILPLMQINELILNFPQVSVS